MTKSTIDFDKAGHCVICHENLLIDHVIDNEVKKRLSPQFDMTQFLLNDGSLMNVVTCKKCKPNIKESDYVDIMNCVYKGWEKETDLLVKDKDKPDWDKKRQENYLKRQSSLELVTTSKGKDDPALLRALAKHKEKK